MNEVEIGFKDKRCWSAALQAQRKSKKAEELKSKWQDRFVLTDCGGWKPEDLAVVLDNTELANELYEVKTSPYFTREFMASLAAPYLVGCGAMQSECELIAYLRDRIRSDVVYRVLETEEVTASIRCVGCDEHGIAVTDDDDDWLSPIKRRDRTPRKPSEEMVLAIDFEIMANLCCNAALQLESNGWSVAVALPAVYDQLKKNHGDVWALTSPELAKNISVGQQTLVTPFLVKTGQLTLLPDVTCYTSVLLPENVILMGVKGLHAGYVFMPYVFPVPDYNNYLRFSYGRKLLREGSKQFGVIRIK